jgi:hypothetical protein
VRAREGTGIAPALRLNRHHRKLIPRIISCLTGAGRWVHYIPILILSSPIRCQIARARPDSLVRCAVEIRTPGYRLSSVVPFVLDEQTDGSVPAAAE